MNPNAENEPTEPTRTRNGSSALRKTTGTPEEVPTLLSAQGLSTQGYGHQESADDDHAGLTLGERLAREAEAKRRDHADPPTGFVSTGPIREAIDPATGAILTTGDPQSTQSHPVIRQVGSSGDTRHIPTGAAPVEATPGVMPSSRQDTRFDDEAPRGLAGIMDQGTRPEPDFLNGFDDDEVGEYVPGQWDDAPQESAAHRPRPSETTLDPEAAAPTSPANTTALPVVASTSTGLKGAAAVGAHEDLIQAERRRDEDTPFLRRSVEDSPAEPAVSPEAEYANRLALLDREKEEFGGLKLGSGFFGWLTAAGMMSILTLTAASVLGAVAYMSNMTSAEVTRTVKSYTTGAALTGSQGLSAAVLAGVCLFVSFLAGGYVAGRMARFSGLLQGFGVWLWFLAISAALAVAGLFGVGGISSTASGRWLPSARTLMTAETLITVGAIAALTLAAALIGGALGMRYHRRIDRFDYTAAHTDEV